METKVIVITGTSTGLGLKTAIKLAGDSYYTVVATMRDLTKKSQLEKEAAEAGVNLKIKSLDVTNQESIEACINAIVAEEGQIDVLINNAGAGFLKASELSSEREILQVMDVNYFGLVRVTNAVLPIMRKQKSGHIINISSVGGLVGQPFNELYCAAKFAVEGYTEALATYITPAFGVNFTLLEPGGITTDFAANVFKKLSESTTDQGDYGAIFQKYMEGLQSRSKEDIAKIYQTGDEVAEVILTLIKNENPPLRMRTSEWAEEFTKLKTSADPDGLLLVNKLRKAYFGV